MIKPDADPHGHDARNESASGENYAGFERAGCDGRDQAEYTDDDGGGRLKEEKTTDEGEQSQKKPAPYWILNRRGNKYYRSGQCANCYLRWNAYEPCCQRTEAKTLIYT
ncbi:hypothetical protein EV102420_06_00530 [Pseudescherichia vulneris NBRC 102420]|uniref:Uncharacterized protein n=1 Tax=Pseudescherichia vulneris NBRC 102420 TaxID=1115515 RepID=A0A090VPZ5_PSEVU|nr:hypothetical protein EV102420_06_00530 [Pseudescherichia vulneris NBRC 102420]